MPRNPPVKIVNRLRFDRIMAMSLWPRFFWPAVYVEAVDVSGASCGAAGDTSGLLCVAVSRSLHDALSTKLAVEHVHCTDT